VLLVQALPGLGANIDMFEVTSSEEYSKNNEEEYFRLDIDKLRNILSTYDNELERQRELGFDEAENSV
jgi:hypothetical protein